MTKKEFEVFVAEMAYVIHSTYSASNPKGSPLSLLISNNEIYVSNADEHYPIDIRIESLGYKKKHAADE